LIQSPEARIPSNSTHALLYFSFPLTPCPQIRVHQNGNRACGEAVRTARRYPTLPSLPSCDHADISGDSSNISEPTSGVSAERGQQTADNVGYGQNVSESGIGGMTTTSSGDAQQGGYGGTEAQDTEAKNTRREQGMGPGNNVGA
jgi:hypothetical protein